MAEGCFLLQVTLEEVFCSAPTFLPPSFPPSPVGEVGRISQLEQGVRPMLNPLHGHPDWIILGSF